MAVSAGVTPRRVPRGAGPGGSGLGRGSGDQGSADAILAPAAGVVPAASPRATRIRAIAVRFVPIVLGVATVLFAWLTVVLHLTNGGYDETSWWLVNALGGLALIGPGFVIMRRRPRNAIGWVLGVAALSEVTTGVGREYLVWGATGGNATAWREVGWFCDPLFMLSSLLLPVLVMIFPDGRPWGRFGRTWLAVPLFVGLAGYLDAIGSNSISTVDGKSLRNPLGTAAPSAVVKEVGLAVGLAVLFILLASLVRMVLRLRVSSGQAREQFKWLTWASVINVAELISEFLPLNPYGHYTGVLAIALMSAAVAVAVLRHRLLDIDVVIQRTLVYVAMTALVIGCYLLVVLGFGALIGEHASIGLPLVATAFVAVGFSTVRLHVQRWVRHGLFGDRDEPERVIARLGRDLGESPSGDALSVVVQTVRHALRVPYVALLSPEGTLIACAGSARWDTETRPVTFRGEQVGTLQVAPRSPGGGLDTPDERLLADLVPQVGAAVSAVRLSSDLQRSRRRLVSAKEEERRRLRRDLHDGLGPQLAALGLKLDAARMLVAGEPDQARAVLAGVKDDIRGTLEDIRRLVYGLRPPALDELGLVAALRERARQLEGGPGTLGVCFRVDAPANVPVLPAAVEVAAFWMGTEAMTNVVRHAQATACTVRLELTDDALELNITDNGTGPAAGWRPGVGTASMAERAAELGGSCTLVAAAAGGTRVHACLPLATPDQPAARRATRIDVWSS